MVILHALSHQLSAKEVLSREEFSEVPDEEKKQAAVVSAVLGEAPYPIAAYLSCVGRFRSSGRYYFPVLQTRPEEYFSSNDGIVVDDPCGPGKLSVSINHCDSVDQFLQEQIYENGNCNLDSVKKHLFHQIKGKYVFSWHRIYPLGQLRDLVPAYSSFISRARQRFGDGAIKRLKLHLGVGNPIQSVNCTIGPTFVDVWGCDSVDQLSLGGIFKFGRDRHSVPTGSPPIRLSKSDTTFKNLLRGMLSRDKT